MSWGLYLKKTFTFVINTKVLKARGFVTAGNLQPSLIFASKTRGYTENVRRFINHKETV